MPSTTPSVSVLIADDDPLVHQAYRMMLSTADDFSIVGSVYDGNEAMRAYQEFHPDITLMDLQMPGRSGVDAIRGICERFPAACIVAITTFSAREHVVAALRAGASGYLLKDIAAPALIEAMRQALAGEMPLSAAVRRLLVNSIVADRVRPEPPPDLGLTPRELELLGWLAQGLSNHEISSRMYVSEGSIKQYLSHIGDRLGVRSRTQILVQAIRLGIIDPHQAGSGVKPPANEPRAHRTGGGQ